jgi:hypothetical protein
LGVTVASVGVWGEAANLVTQLPSVQTWRSPQSASVWHPAVHLRPTQKGLVLGQCVASVHS